MDNRRPSLFKIGASEFDLTRSQIAYCLGRARNLLVEIRELTRARGKQRLPVDSDAAIQAWKDKGARPTFQFIDSDVGEIAA